jgi:hypothetical protein
MGLFVPYSFILDWGKAYHGQAPPFLASSSLMMTEQNETRMMSQPSLIFASKAEESTLDGTVRALLIYIRLRKGLSWASTTFSCFFVTDDDGAKKKQTSVFVLRLVHY